MYKNDSKMVYMYVQMFPYTLATVYFTPIVYVGIKKKLNVIGYHRT